MTVIGQPLLECPEFEGASWPTLNRSVIEIGPYTFRYCARPPGGWASARFLPVYQRLITAREKEDLDKTALIASVCPALVAPRTTNGVRHLYTPRWASIVINTFVRYFVYDVAAIQASLMPKLVVCRVLEIFQKKIEAVYDLTGSGQDIFNIRTREGSVYEWKVNVASGESTDAVRELLGWPHPHIVTPLIRLSR